MKVLGCACPECHRMFLKITLFGEWYLLLECMYCQMKFRVDREEICKKGLEVLDHE